MNNHFGVTLEVDFSKSQWRFGLHVSAMSAQLMGVLKDYPARGALALWKKGTFRATTPVLKAAHLGNAREFQLLFLLWKVIHVRTCSGECWGNWWEEHLWEPCKVAATLGFAASSGPVAWCAYSRIVLEKHTFSIILCKFISEQNLSSG